MKTKGKDTHTNKLTAALPSAGLAVIQQPSPRGWAPLAVPAALPRLDEGERCLTFLCLCS